jgi:hypothetical protein
VQLGDGQRLASATIVRNLRRTGAIQPDESAIARPRKKLRIDERLEDCITHVALQAPEAPRLSGSQSKSRHFYVFTLDSLEHFVDTHRFPPKGPSIESFPVLLEKQPAYRGFFRARLSGGKQKLFCLNASL